MFPTFTLHARVYCADVIEHGLKIVAVGDCRALGNWNPERGHDLSFDTTDRVWKADLHLPLDGTEYKYVIVSSSSGQLNAVEPYWESGPNRSHVPKKQNVPCDVLEHTVFRWNEREPLVIIPPSQCDDGGDPLSAVFIDRTIEHEDMPYTLSFQILDDLRIRYEIDVALADRSVEAITAAVDRIAKPFLDGEHGDLALCGYYFDCEFRNSFLGHIVKGLQRNGFHVLNRFEKYYVYAWAIDHVRFDVHSRDCDSEKIHWSGGSGRYIPSIDDESQ